MTTKEASDKFNLPEGTIRTLCKNGKILGVTKRNRRYVIPDDTVIIVKDSDVRVFLRQLLKYKNNPNIILSIASLDTTEKLETWHKYLLNQGLIGECQFSSDINTLLGRMALTDAGFAMAF